MTLTDTIGMSGVSFITLNKTDDEKSEGKDNYNSFMNFMTDIIVKYGLNEDE